MTNLNSSESPWKAYLTRERVLVGTPLLVGALLGACLFAIAGLPHWLESGERTRRISELKVQDQSLSSIAARVEQNQQKLETAQQQQDLVVNLVAGRGQIETFLAQLSRTAAESGVIIKRYEPVGGEDQAKAPPDLKGYEKTSVLLEVRGPFVGMLQFLRAMEKLELLVQPSDLELKAVSPESKDDGPPVGPPLTELKLRLSFFDKKADGDQDVKATVDIVPQSRVSAPF